MLSKNRIKQINALQQKKYRIQSGRFVAEGHKVVAELLRSKLKICEIFATQDWAAENSRKYSNTQVTIVSDTEIAKISAMQTACNVIAEVEMKNVVNDFRFSDNLLYLALDSVRDPGNFGTIIRIANWFGINTILASDDCVDLYNPKVIQASMGSAFRVNVHYCDLTVELKTARNLGLPIYGTFLCGDNIYQSPLSKNGVIVMGNEGHGISPSIATLVSNNLCIPCGSSPEMAPESLNVSSATAVICSEFLRKSTSSEIVGNKKIKF